MAFDPATLSLSGWWRANFTSSPWTPSASAGASGSNGNLSEATNPPATGAAQNGLTPADFDGTTHRLVASATWSTLFTAGAGSIACLFYADSAPAAAGLVYDNPALLVDGTSGFNGLHFSASGVHAYVDSGGVRTLSAAASTGAYHLAQMFWDGTFLYLRVDGGAWSTVACGSASNILDFLAVGRNYASTAFFDGRILEILTAATAFSFGNFDSIGAYVQERYALSLGFAGDGAGQLATAAPFRGVAARGPVRHFIPSPKDAAFLVTAQRRVELGFRDYAGSDDPMPLTVGPGRHFIGPKMLGLDSAQRFVARGFPRPGLPVPVGLGPVAVGPVDGYRTPGAFLVTAQRFVARGFNVPGGAPVGLPFTYGPFSGQVSPLAGAFGAATAPTGDIAGAASLFLGQSGELSATAALVGTNAIALGQSGAISATAEGAGSASFTLAQSASIAAVAALGGSASLALAQSGAISAAASLGGSAPAVFGQSAAISAAASLSGVSPIVLSPSGALSAAARLDGSTAIAFGQTGSLLGTTSAAATGMGFPGVRNHGRPWAQGPFSISARSAYAYRLATPFSDIAGTASITLSQSGAVAAVVASGGSASLAIAQSGAISGRVSAGGTAAVTLGQSATVAARVEATGTTTIAFGQSGAIAARASLEATAAFALSQSGALAAYAKLAGIAPLVFDATGAIVAFGGAQYFDLRAAACYSTEVQPVASESISTQAAASTGRVTYVDACMGLDEIVAASGGVSFTAVASSSLELTAAILPPD